MIPWDTFNTPQDAYDWAVNNFGYAQGPDAQKWLTPAESCNNSFYALFRTGYIHESITLYATPKQRAS